jgi:hypothetical protein
MKEEKNKYCRCNGMKFYLTKEPRNLVIKRFGLKEIGVGLFMCRKCKRPMWSM